MSSVLSMINCTAIKIQMETVRMGFVADKTMLTLHQISNLYFSGGEGVGGEGSQLSHCFLSGVTNFTFKILDSFSNNLSQSCVEKIKCNHSYNVLTPSFFSYYFFK